MSRLRISPVSALSYAYIVVAAALGHLLPLSNSLKCIIAQPVLIILPYLVGKPFLFIGRKLLGVKESNNFAIDVFVSWCLGTVLMVSLEAALYVNYIFALNSFTLALLVLGLPSVFIKENSGFDSLKHIEIAIVAVYCLIFALFVTRFWPYPYANDNDYITHTFFVTRITIQNRPLLFYGDYLPTMQTIYAVMMQMMRIDPYLEPVFLLWSSRFILYPIFGIGLYLFAHQFTKDRLLSLLVACIGTSLISIVNGCIFPYHTAPKNFIDLMFIYGIYTALNLYEADDEERNRDIIPSLVGLGIFIFVVFIPLNLTSVTGKIGYEIGFILPVLFVIPFALARLFKGQARNFVFSLALVLSGLIFMAKMQGLAAAGTIIAFVFSLWFLSRLSLNKARFLAAVAVAVTAVTLMLVYFKVIPYPELPLMRPNDELIGFYGITNLARNFNSIYPPVLASLAGAGGIFALLSRDEERKYLAAVVMVSLLMFAYFTPIYLVFRFLGTAHPFIVLLAIYAIFRLVRLPVATSQKPSALLPLMLITVFVALNVYTNDIRIFPKGETYLDKEDFQIFQVGRFIKDNIDKGALIIQSNYYQQLSAFYGGVDVNYLWKGGRFYDSYVMDIYKAQSGEEAYAKARHLLEIQDQVVRYSDKDGKDIKRFYKPPTDVILLCDDPLLAHIGASKGVKFYDPRYFDLLFTTRSSRGDNFFVFRVKPEPSVAGYENLVKNPSFEDGLDTAAKSALGWEQVWDKQNWSARLDTEVKHEGNSSYRMETSVTKPQSWGGLKSEDIPVEAGKAYLFSAWIKTQNMLRAYTEIDYYDRVSGRYTLIAVLGPAEANSDWAFFSKYIEIPANVSSVTIFPAAGWVQDETKGTGISWFDDIQFIGPIEVALPR
ncbi:MAG: carbohydrate binding domain-containing protein [Chloroflexota bacterium]